MDGFRVDPDELRRASKAAAQAAAEAGQVEVPPALTGVGAALPGSRSATELDPLTSACRGTLATWCADTRAYAERLATAAIRYASGDQAASARHARAPLFHATPV